MKNFDSVIRVRPQLLAVLLGVLVAACGGGSGGGDPILGPQGNVGAAPMVTATFPAATTPIVTGVAINAKITATFSKSMDATTLNSPATNFTVACPAGTAITGTVLYVDASRTATFSHTANFPLNTTCTATITTSVKGYQGIPMAQAFVWQFKTGSAVDTVRPTVTLTVPAAGATGVAANTLVTATFSEDMDPTTITGTSFTLVNTTLGGTAIAGNVSYSPVGRIATFTPTTPATLPNSTLFTATVTTVAADLAGNTMAANKVWTFTTGAALDTTPPTVTLVNPADLATGVCINKTVNATFSEAMDATTITTTTFTLAPTASPGAPVVALVSYDPLTKIAALNPTGNLSASTQYSATVIGGTSGVKDLAGNPLAVNKAWTFTTGTSSCAAAPALGAAATFGSLGGITGATNTGISTVVTGDMSSTATTTSAITGFHDAATPVPDIYTETAGNIGLVTGRIYTCTVSTTGPTSGAVNPASCTVATNALADAQTAYNSLVAVPGGIDPSGAGGELGGLTLGPGVYKTPTSFMVGSGDLTLDGQGDANAVWIFQMGSTLTIGDTVTPRNIILKPGSGAQAKNVYWQVGSSATINGIVGGGTIQGTIVAAVKVTISTVGVAAVTTLNGRAIGLTAQTVMNNTVVNVPAP
jgi:hypothetical protein